MKKDETFVHVAIRRFLKEKGWKLVAGQYPGGSDDELHVFNIFDPSLAKDFSPDHRRHSFGKLVPDLIAYKNKKVLIIEAKPEYSIPDKEKLEYLLSERRQDFLQGLTKFALERNFSELLPSNDLQLIPVLAYLAEYDAPNETFAQLKVIDLEHVVSEKIELE